MASHHDQDWTLALAGGEGVRLQDYVSQRFGEPIPKQYCPLVDHRSMLQSTLDRMNQLTPPARTLTVIGPTHRKWAVPQLVGRSDHLLCQPSSKDTAIALYVALAMITRWEPEAIVTITPTDHYIEPAARFLETLTVAQAMAGKLRDLVVLLGVAPSEPDPELGYIVPGAAISDVPGVRSVAAFVEKPTVARAAELRAEGALWSMMIACASASALWELGRAACPDLIELCESLVPLIGTEDEDDAIEYVYRTRPPISFSRDICEKAPSRVATMRIADVEWSDLGTPPRIERVIARRRSSEAELR